MLVDIAEGVGGALMLGGRLYQGPLPMSGEMGHTPIPGNARPCGCGGRGCLETLASERGMIESHRESKGRGTTFADVVRAAEREPPPWMRATFDAVATCLSAGLNIYGIRRAVLVGRVTDLPGARDRLSHRRDSAGRPLELVRRRGGHPGSPSVRPAGWSSPGSTAS